MNVNMKNRSHRYDTNRPKARHTKYKVSQACSRKKGLND